MHLFHQGVLRIGHCITNKKKPQLTLQVHKIYFNKFNCFKPKLSIYVKYKENKNSTTLLRLEANKVWNKRQQYDTKELGKRINGERGFR